MGYGGYSYDKATLLRSTATSDGYGSTFRRDEDVKAGRAVFAIHEDVDPTKIKNGIRESRDSDDHPNSCPIAVFLDVTGSMSNSPKKVMDEFPQLMATIIKDAGIEDPHLLFGAIGDAYCDRAPFQVSQFEADNKTEEQISHFLLEGGGGSNRHESYDLAMYFLARMTSCDAWEKRGEKGFAFIVQDEPPPPHLPKEHVKSVFGQTIQDDISFAEIIKEAEEKWNIFILRLQTTSMGSDANITKQWKKFFGQNVIDLPNEKSICGLIATILAQQTGADVDKVADTMGLSGKTLSDVKTIVIREEGAIVKGGKSAATGTIEITKEEAAERL